MQQIGYKGYGIIRERFGKGERLFKLIQRNKFIKRPANGDNNL